MILFNLRHAIRNFKKNRLYTIINISGLAIGLAAFIVIIAFVKYHTSFNKFNKNYANIYRINQITDVSNSNTILPCTPFALIHEIKNKFPEIRSITRTYFSNFYLSNGKDKTYFEGGGLFADSSLFEIFDFDIIRSNKPNVLATPMSIVLSESLAKKYFPHEDPLGKRLRIETGKILTVSGIMRDTPYNSSLRCRYLISFDALRVLLTPDVENQWDWCMASTFVMLKDNADPELLSKKIENLTRGRTIKIESNKLVLYPLSRIHLQFVPDVDFRPHIWLAGIVAVFILIIAAINFMNLSTAYSSVRVKEIGLRKLSGAGYFHIIRQFMGEALVITGISLLLALFLSEICLTYLKSMLPQGFSIAYPGLTGFILLLLCIVLTTGILAGSYPSFYLSSLQPSRAIKGMDKFTLRSPLISRILVILQYVIFIVLIVSTFVIYRQIQFMQKLDMGFNRNNIIIGNCQLTAPDAKEKYEKLKRDFKQQGGIIDIAQSHSVPLYGIEWWEVYLDSLQRSGSYHLEHNHIDFYYLKTYGIQIIEGRALTPDSADDVNSHTCLINEETVKKFGWEKKAIGKYIYSDRNVFRVVGIMKNFHLNSVMNAIEPCFFSYTTRQFNWPNFYSVKIAENKDPVEMISCINQKFREYFPDDIIEFWNYNRDFDRINTGFITSMGTIFAICASIALSIALIGLFGLVSFITRQRTKEIGIRKANGAKTFQLFTFIAREFVTMIIIANIVAAPVAWLLTRQILNTMPYHIAIPWASFIVVALLSIILTFLTIGAQIVKVASINPSESLRFE